MTFLIANAITLVFLYFFLRYIFKYLANQKIRSRYKFALFLFILSILQTLMCFFWGVLPGLILLYAYLFGPFYIFLWIQKIFGYDFQNSWYSWIFMILSQIPVYTLFGLLLGIFTNIMEP